MKRIIDISIPIENTMVTWPGDPSITLERTQKIEDGYESNVSRLDMGVHTGTHVDAPYHFLANGVTIEKLPIDILIGEVEIVRIPDEVDEITVDVLEKVHLSNGVKRVIFKTKNTAIWINQKSKFYEKFVAILPDAAHYLVKQGVKLVGIDYLSVAPFTDGKTTHQVLLCSGMVAIEGLNLRDVEAGLYTLVCLPLKLVGADGAPARVVLLEE
jgi:arylformamidase